MIWNLPGYPPHRNLSDKHLVTGLFLSIVCYRFPTSLLALLSAVIGLCIWNSDHIVRHEHCAG
jgi:hypothetical protein